MWETREKGEEKEKRKIKMFEIRVKRSNKGKRLGSQLSY